MNENAAATIARLNTTDESFDTQLNALLDWEGVSDSAVQARVDDILTNVKRHGDAAVIEATNRFDRVSVTRMDELRLTAEQLRNAFEHLPVAQRDALASAAERIRRYHERQNPRLGNTKSPTVRCLASR